ncbi:MAG: glycosyltransferase family 4 protein [Phycisphaerales bacterium]|nr:MAG: glycosyltransferase family 4 protein [Phycisphaerales bacterium]
MARKILHLVHSLPIAGMERVLVSLANGLQKRGWPQTVCCLRQTGALAESLSPQVDLVAMNAKGRDWALARRLRCLADQRRPDLVHGQNLGTWCDVVRAFAGRYPVVQSFHGFLKNTLPLPQRVLARRLARRTDRLVAVSQPLAREMARRFEVSPDSIDIVANGIDTDHFTPQQPGRHEVQIRASVKGRFLCVTVASLSPAKSPETLVQTARRLPDNIAFIWVGTGPLEKRVRQMIEDAGLRQRFLLAGAHADVRPFLRAADVFVLPSHTEALPISALEAQAVGLPVVATSVGALPEIVAQSQTGLLSEPENPDALSACIMSLADDPATRHRMGRAARDSVIRRFSLSRMIDRYIAIYESLIGAAAQLAGGVQSTC